MTVKLAVVEGALLNQADAFAMADLPSREVLLAQLLGLLQAPASQLVRVLNAKLASIVYVLDAYCKKKDEQVA
jgi:large subunit ribosomal protein L10